MTPAIYLWIAAVAFVLAIAQGDALFFRGRTSRWIREILLDLANGFRAARRQRQMIEAAKANDAAYLANRPRIVRVGEVTELPNGGFQIEPGWSFHFASSTIGALGYAATHEDLDGKKRIYGYTLAELRQYHARRVEFNVDA